jgi:ribosomal protein S18 acetylase RimI-like enzyme
MESSASFICEADGELVGMAFLVSKGNPNDIFEAGWSYVRMVGVNPKYAGKGIGKKLSQMCIDYAIETHEDFIALHTSEFMDAARHVYENLGFKKLREIDTRFGKRYWIYILDLKGKQ